MRSAKEMDKKLDNDFLEKIWKDRQREIKDWMINKIGDEEQFTSTRNRAQRFLEESIELVQAIGLDVEDCLYLVQYVYDRPQGNISQEVGGVAVTLAALCENLNINAAKCLNDEIDRIHKPEMIEKVRAAIIRKRNDGVGI